jgi:hypothetical protein
LLTRCLFCKQSSVLSRSMEHVVPESLWNTQHVLPPGVVCDACNNYFSREVERPFLESPSIRALRFHEAIPSKRGRIPDAEGILTPGFPVVARRLVDGPYKLALDLSPEAFAHVLNQKEGIVLLPVSSSPPPDNSVSRLLAKMAIEAMALRLLDKAGGLEYLVDEIQLDELRDHARRGNPRTWPYHSRRIYESDRRVIDSEGGSGQTVHEFDFLVTEHEEWYFVFALFGHELTINMGGPEVEGYISWLAAHDQASPLYWGKNASL